MGRPPCCDKANVKRGLWTAEEDAKILAYVSTHGTGNWTQVPKKAGLNRCGKSCRLRWTNYLRPDLKHEEFTDREEELIIQYHAAIGSRWSLIAKQLPGRTDNDVKNYWNTKLKKKLSKVGIDPVTHKPFTKIFSDFQSISCQLTSIHHEEPTLFVNKNAKSSSLVELGSQQRVDMGHQFQDNYGLLLQNQESMSISNHYMMEELSPTTSSSSSSSSCSSISNRQFNWNRQSLSQPLRTTTGIKEEEEAEDKSKGPSYCKGGTERSVETSNSENSSVSSFIKTLLDRDSEMQLNFPVFEEILHY